jgi:hypothetical protein
MSEDVHTPQLYPPRQPLTSQPNGFTKPAHFDGQDSQRQYYEDEPAYLVPSRVSDLHRKPSGDLSASNSDPDSVLEYYKGPDGKNGSRSRSASQAASVRNKKKGVKPENWEQLEQDHNNWIHRDKLKEIEIREMEEAGFRVGRSSRSNSRSQNVGLRKRDRKNSELTDPMSNNEDDDPPPRKRVVSTIAAADEEEDNEQLNWDLRTPEEIAADNEQWAIRHNNNNHNIRPSTSRIPVAKMSPVPVPHTYVERDAPLPRSRKGSAHWTGDALAINGARVRSGSVSSQVLMDDADATEEFAQSPLQRNFSNPVSPVNRSPQKAKTPAKPLPTSGARKTSTTLKAPAKPRNVSGPSPKRPGTSGGSVSRPTTSHRPEGEAPWIATMYKPDPRLPPDQQIIPTHAKRIQQEQWESQGRVGSMYDTDFRLLNTEDFPDKRLSQINPIELEEERERQEQEKQWPLPSSSPTKKHMPERIDTNLRSPTNEQGSYKLTPTIPQSPRVASRSSNHRTAPSISPSKPKNTTRLPEPVQEDEKEKKGCCCIVM